MELSIDVVHFPDAWSRSFEPVCLVGSEGPLTSRVVMVHGPMGVAMITIQDEVWWVAFKRDTGRIYAAWEDLHLAQTFADTFMRLPHIDEMLAGVPCPAGRLDAWVATLKGVIAEMSQVGAMPKDPRTNRPAVVAQYGDRI